VELAVWGTASVSGSYVCPGSDRPHPWRPELRWLPLLTPWGHPLGGGPVDEDAAIAMWRGALEAACQQRAEAEAQLEQAEEEGRRRTAEVADLLEGCLAHTPLFTRDHEDAAAWLATHIPGAALCERCHGGGCAGCEERGYLPTDN